VSKRIRRGETWSLFRLTYTVKWFCGPKTESVEIQFPVDTTWYHNGLNEIPSWSFWAKPVACWLDDLSRRKVSESWDKKKIVTQKESTEWPPSLRKESLTSLREEAAKEGLTVCLSAAGGTTPRPPPHTHRKPICQAANRVSSGWSKTSNSQTTCFLKSSLFPSPLFQLHLRSSHPVLHSLSILSSLHLFLYILRSSSFSVSVSPLYFKILHFPLTLCLTFHPSLPPHHRKHPSSCYCYHLEGATGTKLWMCVACPTLMPPSHTHINTHSICHFN